MQYRTATPQDIFTITALAKKIWLEHYPSIISMAQIEYMLDKMYSQKSLEEQLASGHTFIIAAEKGTDVGFISTSSDGKGNYALHKFYIDVAEHGKGLGTEFFTHVLTTLQNAKTITLTVNRQNIKAINFYFKNGFTIAQVADFDIGNGYVMNDFVMIKRLNV